MVTKKNLEGYAGFLINTRIGRAKICLNQSFLAGSAGHASLHIQNIEHFLTFEHIQNIEHFLTFEHIQYIEHFLTFEHIQNIEHFFISELEAFGFWQFSLRGSSFPPARTAFGRPRYPLFAGFLINMECAPCAPCATCAVSAYVRNFS
jgi:hypothetical protein